MDSSQCLLSKHVVPPHCEIRKHNCSLKAIWKNVLTRENISSRTYILEKYYNMARCEIKYLGVRMVTLVFIY